MAVLRQCSGGCGSWLPNDTEPVGTSAVGDAVVLCDDCKKTKLKTEAAAEKLAKK